MSKRLHDKKSYLDDLGDGLLLRRATPDDGEILSKFNTHIHQRDDTNEPDERVGVWARDLIERPHPTFRPGDFTIVEDTSTGAIVASMNLVLCRNQIQSRTPRAGGHSSGFPPARVDSSPV
ncbi:hypothetical protein ACFLY4_07080 [Chloroflexota bacterium]